VSTTLASRLDQILPRITSDAFLSSEGIGNEIACYIFDYPASEELRVREHLELVKAGLSRSHSGVRFLHLNLLDVVCAYLDTRGLLDKAKQMFAKKGDAGVLRALKGPLAAVKVCDFIATEYKPADYDLVLLSGVGSAWPMVRAHSLLNCLHPVLANTPLVMFYPGSFDGTTLRMFGDITMDAFPTGDAIGSAGARPYYRAFMLVPGETEV